MQHGDSNGFPITSTAVADGIGAEVKPLKNKLEIIDASGQIMDIIGTIRMYINNRVLGGRKLVEAAVVRPHCPMWSGAI